MESINWADSNVTRTQLEVELAQVHSQYTQGEFTKAAKWFGDRTCEFYMCLQPGKRTEPAGNNKPAPSAGNPADECPGRHPVSPVLRDKDYKGPVNPTLDELFAPCREDESNAFYTN